MMLSFLLLLAAVPAFGQPCYTCTGGDYSYTGKYWCGGSGLGSQLCVNSESECPSSYCSTSSSSGCSLFGSTTCTSPTSTLLLGGGASGTLQATATRMLQGAVAASFIIAFFWTIVIGAYAFRCSYPTGAPPHPFASPAMDQWKPRAQRAMGPQFAGYFFLTLGISASIAAFAMPWWYNGLTVSYGGNSAGGNLLITGWGMTFELCTSNTGCDQVSSISPLIVGAAIVYAGVILLLFPAWVMASVALCRMRGVAAAGVPPPLSCCMPSLPAIQGTAWVGLAVVTVGCAVDWFIMGVFTAIISSSSLGNAGSSYLAFAFACIVVACILFSVVGCCTIGHLPGLGRSRTCCCCGERNAQSPETLEAPGGQPKVTVRAPSSASAV